MVHAPHGMVNAPHGEVYAAQHPKSVYRGTISCGADLIVWCNYLIVGVSSAVRLSCGAFTMSCVACRVYHVPCRVVQDLTVWAYRVVFWVYQ